MSWGASLMSWRGAQRYERKGRREPREESPVPAVCGEQPDTTPSFPQGREVRAR